MIRPRPSWIHGAGCTARRMSSSWPTPCASAPLSPIRSPRPAIQPSKLNPQTHMKLRITTFNVQNMFNRYAFLDQPFTGRDFEQTVMATGVVSLASQQGDLVPYATTTIQRNNTALAIFDAQPDILAVQEIENIYTGPDHKDLKSLTVGGIRTHIDEAANKKEMVSRRYIGQLGGKAAYLAPNAIFSRDCLEVDVVIAKKDGTKKTLTLLVNHLKSQLGGKPSDERRLKQSTRVAAIVNENV